MIVRSNGVVTYVGKDIANQFWKFGLLGRDFHYRRFAIQAGAAGVLWSTTSENGEAAHPPFGHAQRIYNVIDSRQMYLQALLSQALRALGHAREAENSIHFSYEMVALSHATARELGYETRTAESVEAKKPFVEVSGRKGLGVKVDDLLDLLTDKAAAEVARRNPDFSAGGMPPRGIADCRRGDPVLHAEVFTRQADCVRHRGGAQLRGRNRSLPSVRGGPRQQHPAQAAGAGGPDRRGHRRARSTARDADELTEEASDLWALVLEAARLDEVVDQVVRSLEFSGLAKYAFGLAQLFNAFYHRYPILKEDADRAETVARRRGGLLPHAAHPRAGFDGD